MGLIPAPFLTPCYEITFTASADDWKRLKKRDAYNNLSMLTADTDKQVVFLGGKDYAFYPPDSACALCPDGVLQFSDAA